MTNWEHLFGTPERAIHTETEFHSWPFFIAVYETSRMSSCTTSKRLLASFCEEANYLEWLKAEYDDAIRALALGLMAMAVAACG